jgi:hypothetical protein
MSNSINFSQASPRVLSISPEQRCLPRHGEQHVNHPAPPCPRACQVCPSLVQAAAWLTPGTACATHARPAIGTCMSVDRPAGGFICPRHHQVDEPDNGIDLEPPKASEPPAPTTSGILLLLSSPASAVHGHEHGHELGRDYGHGQHTTAWPSAALSMGGPRHPGVRFRDQLSACGLSPLG